MLLTIVFAVVGPAVGVRAFCVVGDGDCDARWALPTMLVMVMMVLVFFSRWWCFFISSIDGVVCFSR